MFSYSGTMIAWRAGRPQGQDLTDYLNLLEAGLVEPLDMQLYQKDREEREREGETRGVERG